MTDVTSYRVTGDWRHIIDDGMVDTDDLPDETRPTGYVRFVPLSPRVAVTGAPATAYTLSVIKVLIAAGELRDLQGREGVMLPGRIGDEVVRWRAETYLEFQGQPISYPDLEFELSGDAHLTGLIQNDVPGQPPIVIDPRIEGLVQQAQATLVEMQTFAAGLEQSTEDAEAAASNAADSASAAAGSASAAAGSATAAANSATAAQTARTGAETARTQAQTARTGAETARTGAETAKTGAETARQGVEDARDAAEGHATAASQSASAAAGSATSAAQSATAAQTARTGAETAATEASTSASAAAGSASDAAGSATSAAGSEASVAADAGAAQTAATQASGHANNAASSASDAAGSATAASNSANDAAGSATTAEQAAAEVIAILQDAESFQDVQEAIGHLSAEWQADIAAAVDDLLGGAGEAFDTLKELQDALGSDPDFANTVLTELASKVNNTDPRLTDARTPTAHTHAMGDVTGLQGALDGKASVSHSHTWAQVTDKPSTFTPSTHSHTVAQVSGLQTALDGKAATSHTHAEFDRVAAAPATWRWDGTSLPTSASQVHAQARAGDFIVAPNLTTNPGWHQITGV